MTITHLSQLDLNQNYTYADYLTWSIKEKIELIKGKIIAMSPDPNRVHQKISLNLTRLLDAYFYKTPCELYYAPFDVRLFSQTKEITTVVQPDLCVICDLSKLDEKGCAGAPDLVVEIISPGNSKKEMSVKFDLYQEAGVKEYWIISPTDETILIYVLQNGQFIGLRPLVRGENQSVQSHTFPELTFAVDDIFK